MTSQPAQSMLMTLAAAPAPAGTWAAHTWTRRGFVLPQTRCLSVHTVLCAVLLLQHLPSISAGVLLPSVLCPVLDPLPSGYSSLMRALLAHLGPSAPAPADGFLSSLTNWLIIFWCRWWSSFFTWSYSLLPRLSHLPGWHQHRQTWPQKPSCPGGSCCFSSLPGQQQSIRQLPMPVLRARVIRLLAEVFFSVKTPFPAVFARCLALAPERFWNAPGVWRCAGEGPGCFVEAPPALRLRCGRVAEDVFAAWDRRTRCLPLYKLQRISWEVLSLHFCLRGNPLIWAAQ